MNILEDDVKEAILRLSDADLTKFIEVDFREHTEEAVAFAKEEMTRRGQLKKKAGSTETSAGSGAVPAAPAQTPAPVTPRPGATPQTASADPAGPAASAGPEVPGRLFAEFASREPSKAAGVWGVIWLVVAAAVTCFTVFITVALPLDEWRSIPFTVLVYAACAAAIWVLLWAGIRRRPRWESVIAKAFVALSVSTFAFFIPASGPAEDPGDRRAFLITAVVMAVMALVFFLLAAAKRRAAARTSP